MDRSTILRRLLLALIVIDGTIDWPFIRMAMKQVPCVRNQRTAPRAGRSAPGSRIAERPPSGGLLICVILDLCLPQLVVNDAVPPLPTDLPHRNCCRHVGLDLAHGRCRRAAFLMRANSEHTFCTVKQPSRVILQLQIERSDWIVSSSGGAPHEVKWPCLCLRHIGTSVCDHRLRRSATRCS